MSTLREEYKILLKSNDSRDKRWSKLVEFAQRIGVSPDETATSNGVTSEPILQQRIRDHINTVEPPKTPTWQILAWGAGILGAIFAAANYFFTN